MAKAKVVFKLDETDQITIIGTIIKCDSTHTYGNDYRIEFDRLKQAGVRYDWYALEKWIQPVENTLMTVE